MDGLTTLGSTISKLEERLELADKMPGNIEYWTANGPVVPSSEVSTDLPCFSDNSDLGRYCSARGLIELREAICSRENLKYGLSLQPENVLVTSGALSAVNLVLRLLSRQNATGLCHAPIFRSINNLFLHHRFQMRFFQLDSIRWGLPELWSMDLHPNDVVFVNSPHNPSGFVVGSEAMQALVDRCAKNHASLVVDAVYDSFDTLDSRCASPLQFTQNWDEIFSIGSLSKNYGAPGCRIGWVASSEKNIDALSGMLEQQMICVSPISQRIGLALIQSSVESVVSQVSETRRMLCESLSKHQRHVFHVPDAGTQFVLELGMINASKLADYALSKHRMLIVTSDNYAGTCKNFVRIPCGYPVQDSLSMLDRLLHVIEQYSDETDIPMA